jgi:hypothetical protein
MGPEGIDPAASGMHEHKSKEHRIEEQKRFLHLLPLTLAVAGLPDVEHGRHLNEGQMEARATTIRTAYKIARQIIHDVTH